jgi:hypothetical protein
MTASRKKAAATDQAVASSPSAEIGTIGLRRSGGRVNEEKLRKLVGLKGLETFSRMALNDSTCGGVLFAIEMLLRSVPWVVHPASDEQEDVERAEFIQSCTEDMDETWEEVVSELLTMLEAGFSLLEIVLKYRASPDQTDPARKSNFSDGLVGIRSLSPRAQETVARWDFDEENGGRVAGFYQRDPSGGKGEVYIPAGKYLHFRTTSRKNNPEGLSLMRRAYRDWYFKSHVEEAEAIGIERDLAGVPVAEYPAKWDRADAKPEEKAAVAGWKNVVRTFKADEQAGLAYGQTYDEKGNPLVKFSLLSTMARRLHDTNAVIARKDHGIARSMLADFIMLGGQQVGSYALADSKTDMFATAVGAWLDSIAAVLNRTLIPLLFRVNGWGAAKLCWFEPGDLDQRDIAQFADALAKLGAAGFVTPGGKLTEAKVRAIIGLPDEAEAEDGLDGDPTDAAVKDPAHALNGAQIAAMLDVVARVQAGQIAPSAGRGILLAGFPLSAEVVDQILGAAAAPALPTAPGPVVAPSPSTPGPGPGQPPTPAPAAKGRPRPRARR